MLENTNTTPVKSIVESDLQYLSGFGSTHQSEALEGALPVGQNSPQKIGYGLYAEQLSGTAFTAPRAQNRKVWFYRILPSVCHGSNFVKVDAGWIRTAPCRDESDQPITQLRWNPIEIPHEPVDFLSGLRTMATCGDAFTQTGMATHVYLANQSMNRRYFYNADGEMLIVPQENRILLFTECGLLEVGPGEICVVPKGMKFKVDLVEETARGYVCENYGAALTLPERGPIGANSLASERDFFYPTAAYEDLNESCELYVKNGGKLFKSNLNHSPLDVVAWHGNGGPYKYDLRRFSPIGSIRLDHPDPSIYTVLTSISDTPGVANVDFVIFPERWTVMEHSFRPPWYHLNVMSEFMGLIYGVYDAKPSGGFVPGGMSLHNALLAHGPDSEAFEKASNMDLKPQRISDTLAFMFETRYPFSPTAYASQKELQDISYTDCWGDLKRNFTPDQKD